MLSSVVWGLGVKGKALPWFVKEQEWIVVFETVNVLMALRVALSTKGRSLSLP